jgi:hypothetical protein
VELTVSAGDLIVAGAAAIVSWCALDVLREVRALARRVTHLEAWASAEHGYKPL